MENRVVETYFNYNLNVKPAFPVIHIYYMANETALKQDKICVDK